MDISIVIPLFNEQESLKELSEWIEQVMKKNGLSYETIMVDDGSTDHSWSVIKDITRQNPNFKGTRFSRNYGKSAALFHGFKRAQGQVVITMDADLQDSPEEIPGLFNMIKEHNFDLVSGWKKKRFDPLSKKIPSRFWNWIARKFTGINLNDFNCGLKAYQKKVIKQIEVYGEMHRYMPVLAWKAGYRNIGEKVVQHQKRKFGKTKFGIERFSNGILDLISISFMSKFGKRPMHFFGTLGIFMFFIGFVLALYLGIHKLYLVYHHVHASRLTESTFFYLSLTAMILGTQLFVGGFLGELISRNSADRNTYLIEEEI